jgi:glyoxylase-like metal-dependent hydrolase (beta-lactamase superfamily II)
VEIAPGIVAVGDDKWGRVRAFLVLDGTELTLVDTLGKDQVYSILAAIRAMGRSISDLKRIVITHAHFSHLGGVAALKEQSGATVCAQRWEADIVSGQRESQRVPILPRHPYRVYFPFQFGQAFGIGRHTPCEVDTLLSEGDPAGRLTVMHRPGHTPGHLAFWSEQDKVLLSGDTIVTWPNFAGGWPSFTLNEHDRLSSLQLMANLNPEKVGVGHGDPITHDAAARVWSLVQ